MNKEMRQLFDWTFDLLAWSDFTDERETVLQLCLEHYNYLCLKLEALAYRESEWDFIIAIV